MRQASTRKQTVQYAEIDERKAAFVDEALKRIRRGIADRKSVALGG